MPHAVLRSTFLCLGACLLPALFPAPLSAAVVLLEPEIIRADLRVFVTQDRSSADLLVYVVDHERLAKGDAYWLITDDRRAAGITVYIGPRNVAQLVICYVATRAEAGWTHPHPWRGRLVR